MGTTKIAPRRRLFTKLVTPDGNIGITSRPVSSTGSHKTVRIEQFWPQRMLASAVRMALLESLPSQQPQRDFYHELIKSAGPLGYYRHFDNPRNFKPASDLGYRLSQASDRAGGLTRTSITFSYPTVAYINSIGIGPIRFKAYPGGQYAPTEFIKTFIDGEVLIATEQPFELHDHCAPHVLGWLYTKPAQVRALRNKMSELMAEDPTPAQLHMAMLELDEFSIEVGRRLLSARPN